LRTAIDWIYITPKFIYWNPGILPIWWS
jgi:hypothetical protein